MLQASSWCRAGKSIDFHAGFHDKGLDKECVDSWVWPHSIEKEESPALLQPADCSAERAQTSWRASQEEPGTELSGF